MQIHLEQLDDAAPHLERALRIASEAGAVFHEARVWEAIGLLNQRKGDLSSAKAAYQRAATGYGEARPQAQPQALLPLGFVCVGLGELAEAEASLHRLAGETLVPEVEQLQQAIAEAKTE